MPANPMRGDPDEPAAVSFYAVGARIYLSLKLSKDRASREEDTEVLKGMYDDEQKRNVGWKVWKKAFGGENKNGSNESGPER